MESQFSLENFQQTKVGKGSFPSEKIWKAQDKITKKFYYMKTLKNPDKKILEIFQSQALALKDLGHANIVKIYEIFVTDDSCSVLIENCNEGLFDSFLEDQPDEAISEPKAIEYFKQILSLFKYLNEKSIIHNNFTMNGLLKHDGLLKISSIGYEIKTNPDIFNEYISPEILEGLDSDKTNIWSLGVFLYRMVFGELPYEGDDKEELLKVIKKKKLVTEVKWLKISQGLKNLLERMLVWNAEERIEWDELYKLVLEGELADVGPIQQQIPKKEEIQIEPEKKSNFIENQHKSEDDDSEDENENTMKASEKLERNIKGHDQDEEEDKTEKYDIENNEIPYNPINIEKSNIYNTEFLKENPDINHKYNPHAIYKQPMNNSNVHSQTHQTNEQPMNNSNVHQQTPQTNEPNEDDIIGSSVKGEKEEIITNKKDGFAMLEKKYMHCKKIIQHHVRVIEDGSPLMMDENDIIINFVWRKQIFSLCQELFTSLKEFKNVLKDKFFDEFKDTLLYERVVQYLKADLQLYECYLDIALSDVKNFGIYDNPLYLKLQDQDQFNKDNLKTFRTTFKEIMYDYILTGRNMVFNSLNEKNQEFGQRFALHLIKVIDCCNHLKAFPFNGKVEDGFDFEEYLNKLENKSIQEMLKNIDIVIQMF